MALRIDEFTRFGRFSGQRGRQAVALATLAILATTATGCLEMSFGGGIKGSGVVAEEQRDVGEFSRVELSGSSDVEIRIGDTPSLLVRGDDNLISILETEVVDGTLRVRPSESYSTRKGLDVIATVRALEGASVRGSGDIVVSGLDVASFEASVMGSGDVKVSGSAERVSAAVRGSGDIDLVGVEAIDAEASVHGSGDIDLRASGSVKLSVFGSGDIRYRGDPEKVSRNVHGSGDITAR